MKPNFVTIFPVAQNVHLIKDVGQIANAMAKNGIFKSTLVCYPNSKTYDNLKTEANHLKIEFLKPSGRFLFMEKAVLSYLKENAKNIDVLHLFHLTKETIYYGLHYLKHNKKGKIYLKMDVYNETLKQEIIYSKKWIFQKFHKLKEQSFLKKISVVSAENPISLDLLKQRFPILENKAILVTNGINVDFISKAFPQPKSFEEKENIILSVGRIGAEEKNYKMLMDSILGCDLNDWKLVLVGPIENNFDSYVEQKIKEHPHLKGKIELVGNVEDRVALYQYYNRSKIFCLTSPFESFGIAFIEAMYFGNYIIGTDGMSSFDYISNDLELGSRVSVNDEEALTLQLNELIIHPEKMEETYSKVQQQVAEKFYWSEIIKNLEEVLSK